MTPRILKKSSQQSATLYKIFISVKIIKVLLRLSAQILKSKQTVPIKKRDIPPKLPKITPKCPRRGGHAKVFLVQ